MLMNLQSWLLKDPKYTREVKAWLRDFGEGSGAEGVSPVARVSSWAGGQGEEGNESRKELEGGC